MQLKRLRKKLTTFLCALKVSFPLESIYAFVEVESRSYNMFKKTILEIYVFLNT